jgi:hypothetical protein
MTNYTDASQKNKSGQSLEKQTEIILQKFGHSYIKQKGGNKVAIDFIVETQHGNLYLECKNQNTTGTAYEKLPFALYKYKKEYNFSEWYIIQGSYKIPKIVYECLDFYDKAWTPEVKTHIITLDELPNILLKKPIYQSVFDNVA